jgi:hypothetical protein
MGNFPRPQRVTGTQVTRPADTTAYASGDLVANSVTAGSVTPITFANSVRGTGYRAKINGATLKTSNATITNGRFYLHLFTAAPTVTNGDNGVLNIASNLAAYLGFIDITLSLSGTGQGGMGYGYPLSQTPGGSIYFISSNSLSLFGLLEARAAYTPASAETFNTALILEQY